MYFITAISKKVMPYNSNELRYQGQRYVPLFIPRAIAIPWRYRTFRGCALPAHCGRVCRKPAAPQCVSHTGRSRLQVDTTRRSPSGRSSNDVSISTDWCAVFDNTCSGPDVTTHALARTQYWNWQRKYTRRYIEAYTFHAISIIWHARMTMFLILYSVVINCYSVDYIVDEEMILWTYRTFEWWLETSDNVHDFANSLITTNP